MKARNTFLLLITFIALGAMKATAIGSETVCTEPVHAQPSATTTDWKEDAAEKVELVGSVNAHNYPTTAWFEYGESDFLNNNTGFIYAGNDDKDVDVNIAADDLRPNTTYFYRIVSKNKLGIVRGEIKTLKTFNE